MTIRYCVVPAWILEQTQNTTGKHLRNYISKAWSLVDRNSEMFIFILTNIPSIDKNLILAKSG